MVASSTHSRFDTLDVRQSVREAINSVAEEYAQTENILSMPVPVVIVCGTAFIMAEARAELGVIEPKDSDSLRDPLSSSDSIDSQVRTWILFFLLSLTLLDSFVLLFRNIPHIYLFYDIPMHSFHVPANCNMTFILGILRRVKEVLCLMSCLL